MTRTLNVLDPWCVAIRTVVMARWTAVQKVKEISSLKFTRNSGHLNLKIERVYVGLKECRFEKVKYWKV